MHNQVLINVEATDIRVAILENGELVELFVEQFNKKSILGNIYKGRVDAIVPGLKAVFVNIGLERNAFLHFQDILSEYSLPDRGRPERLPSSRMQKLEEEEKAWGAEDDEYDPPSGDDADDEDAKEPKAPPRAPKASIPLKVGDTILVQITKEPLGTKGPRVTSYLSLAGRYLVMMPFASNSGGVSRKIMDGDDRRRLKDLLKSLKGEGSGGFIIRTAGLKEGDSAIKEDHAALQSVWREIQKRAEKAPAPALLHDESSIILRLVRDSIRSDVDEILVDSRAHVKELAIACEAMAPQMVDRIHLYESSKNIFEVFEVEKQFQKAIRRKVWLKSGGAIILDETEALTAIDVNSGKYVGDGGDQDSVILKTNLEACHEVSRQLRLRDLGGLVVIDFIDMTNRDHQRQVLAELRNCLRRDNAKYSMTGFSEFGLVEMTRKRVRMSLANAIYKACPYCEGSGKILGEAEIWKLVKYSLVQELTKNPGIESVDVVVNPDIRTYLQKEVLPDIKAIAVRHKVKLNFVGRADLHWEQFEIARHGKSTVSPSPSVVASVRRGGTEKRVEAPRGARDTSYRQP